MKGYGQFCPIAKAAEILAERWTLLLLRDLLLGSRHFNDLRRGIPLMSPTLLSKRLQSLEEAGIVVRTLAANGHGWEYHPTKAAEELKPLIESIGHWGQRWVRSKLTQDELDPAALMWYIHRHLKLNELPQRRVVIYVEFTDLKKMRSWWLVVDNGEVDLCLKDPGYDTDVYLFADLLSLTQVYIGDLSIERAQAVNKVRVRGARELTHSISRWFARSRFADDNPMPVAKA